jgi:RNA polymerase sigma factor (TIGR02999 family)
VYNPGITEGSEDVTAMLLAWSKGDEAALERIVPILYSELHQIARHYMRREGSGHTLQPTALVNEAYLRLVNLKNVDWQDRAHFIALGARVMRRLLVDWARGKQSQKRGGEALTVTLDEAFSVTGDWRRDTVALHDALEALASFDQRKSRVVELRFFGGLTVEESAAVLGVSPDTVMRDWRLAKAWLRRAMGRSDH